MGWLSLSPLLRGERSTFDVAIAPDEPSVRLSMISGLQRTSVPSFSPKGEFVRAFQGFDRQGWKRLEILDAAATLADLRACQAIVLKPEGRRAGSTRSVSTSNGGYVLNGRRGPRPVERRDRGLSLREERPMPRPAIHPGEILADELTELKITPTELSRQTLRTAEPHLANHPGQARHHRRHRASPRPLVPDQRAILAQSAIGL